MASDTQAMVLAVNWPPQAPADGQATRLEDGELFVGVVAGLVLADGFEHVLHGHVAAVERPGRIEPP
jgi:hypothetical protein